MTPVPPATAPATGVSRHEHPSHNRPVGTLRIGQVIGRGSAGTVYLAIDASTGAMMAAKALKLVPGKSVTEDVAKEVTVLK